MVKFQVAAPYAGGLSGTINDLGLSGELPSLFFNVQVRDSQNKLVAFNGTTYDPKGEGSTTLVLNNDNKYKQTLLLPAGTYTFENAVKAAENSTVLLAYGPADENKATISGDNAVVRLKFHAVFDKASSTLGFSMNTERLFTDSTFNLSLRPMTSAVGAVKATVPTTDIGTVTYTMGNGTDGILNGGSKIGVNVTARGTAADSVLNVTASFNAWVRNPGTDTASFMSTSLDFTHAIETKVVDADVVVPEVGFNPLGEAFKDVASTLSGTATDKVQMGDIRVYANSQLVASTVVSEGVTTVTTQADGNWSASWTPTLTGTHELSVVASDRSGNETRKDQRVTVALRDFDLEMNGEMGSGRPVMIPANSDLWIKVNRTSTGDNFLDVFLLSHDPQMGGVAVTFGPTRTNQTPLQGDGMHFFHGNTGVIAGSFYIRLANSTNQIVDGDVFVHPN